MRRVTRVNIATPAYRRSYSGEYVTSLFRLISHRGRPDLIYSFSEVDYADIEVSRNFLISDFYYNRLDADVLLFIDDDMGFAPDLVHAMIDAGEDVVGALYPRRSVNLEALHKAGGRFDDALGRVAGFVGQEAEPRERRGSLVRMVMVGAGLLLITRQAIDRLIDADPALVDRHRFRRMPYARRFSSAFLRPFSKIATEEMEFSEDAAFCRRWLGTGAALWAVADRPVRHVGSLIVQARAYPPEG